MQYLYLLLAIVLEAVGSTSLKLSEGFSKPLPTAIVVVVYVASFYCFSLSIKSIPLGTAYAIWAGMGVALTAIISMAIFKQPADWATLLGMGLIIAGVLTMNLFSKNTAH